MNLNLEAGLLAKIGAGVAGAAGVTGVGVGGCYAAGVLGAPKINYKKLNDSDWATVKKDSYGPQTIGAVYGRYLYAPYSTEKNKASHDDGWKYTFGKFTNANTYGSRHSLFEQSKAQSQYQPQGTTSPKGLNQLCEEVYKRPVSEVDMSENSGTTQGILAQNLVTFCSPLGVMPSSMSNTINTFEENTIGKAKASVLIKTESTEDGFWKAQEKWFISLGEQVTDPYFVEYIKQESGKNSDFLKEACEKAYSLPSNTTVATKEKPLMDDVLKYCTFPGYK